MVIKIDKPESLQEANTQSESFDPPPSKKHKVEKEKTTTKGTKVATTAAVVPLVCAGCKITDKEAAGALLLFDDPEDDGKDKKVGDEKR